MKHVIGKCDITAEEVVQALKNEKRLILATCAGNRVTIRPMSHINEGLEVFFQTGSDSLKMNQMRENSRVALYVGTYEIEGTAIEIGHPLREDNNFFAQAYREKHPSSFDMYSASDDEIVVRVIAEYVRQWRYINDKPFLAEGKL